MTETPIKTITLALKADMRVAMMQKQVLELAEIRSIMARLSNAEAVAVDSSVSHPAVGVGSSEMQRKELSREDIQRVLHDEEQEIKEALTAIEDAGGSGGDLRVRLNVVQKYL